MSLPTDDERGPRPGHPDRRDRPGDGWRRIGMIAPSSNTVLEPETMRMAASLDDRVSVHFARVGVTHISTSARSSDQFGFDGLVDASRRLADTLPHAIVWNGTAASWLGLDRDVELAERMAASTGVACATTMLFYRAAFAALGIRKLALVTPYISDVQERVLANLRSLGLEIVAERRLEDRGNFSFAEYSAAFVAGEIREAIGSARPDAVAVMCTNYRGARAAAEIEPETGVLVLDSVALTLWGALAVAGVPTAPLAAYGRLFAELPAEAARGACALP